MLVESRESDLSCEDDRGSAASHEEQTWKGDFQPVPLQPVQTQGADSCKGISRPDCCVHSSYDLELKRSTKPGSMSVTMFAIWTVELVALVFVPASA